MPSRIRALLFDLGNTLLHFEGAWPQVMQQANQELLSYLKAANLQLDEARFLQLFRNSLDEYYAQREAEFVELTTAYVLRNVLAELGHLQVEDALLDPALEKLYAVSQTHWKPEEDAIPTLETLRSAGYPTGLISNASNDADVQTLVDKAGLRPHLDFVLTSAACGIRKPNPRIFHIALENWGIPPEQAAMVGDTLGADILGARNAGLFSIWISRRADTPANREHAQTIRPDAEINALNELPLLLESL